MTNCMCFKFLCLPSGVGFFSCYFMSLPRQSLPYELIVSSTLRSSTGDRIPQYVLRLKLAQKQAVTLSLLHRQATGTMFFNSSSNARFSLYFFISFDVTHIQLVFLPRRTFFVLVLWMVVSTTPFSGPYLDRSGHQGHSSPRLSNYLSPFRKYC